MQNKKIFAHIEKQSSKNISVRTLCKSFYVSRAGYYKWLLKKEQEQNSLNNNRKGKYDEFILKLVKDAFLDNRMIYGHRRIKVYLQREYGLKLNKETIRRYMSYYGYKSIIRRKSKHRERKNVRYIKPDLIQRNFKSDKPFNKIYTDVTFIPINGKLDKFGYLSVAIDGFNQEVVGYSFSKNNNTKLVMDTMEKLEKGIVESEEVIIHSDHGSQYSSIEYLDFILKNKIKQSMSRVGNSLDNRPAEYFFSILKEEYIRESYKYTFEEIENMIKKSVLHYNVIRFQKALKNLTPIEYRNEVNC